MTKTCPCGKSPEWFKCMCKLPLDVQLQYDEELARQDIWNKFYLEYEKIVSHCDTDEIISFKIQAILRPREEKKIFFVTINPRPDVDLKLFKKLVANYLSRTFVQNELYSFEQTGEDVSTMGKHPHCHIIMDKVKNMSPKQLQDRTYNTFKSICGNKLCCDVRIYSGSLRQDKINYLKGLKWDESKDKASKINIVWRELNDMLTV